MAWGMSAAVEVHWLRPVRKSAEYDFHGLRAKAIEHLNQGIHEAQICEQER